MAARKKAKPAPKKKATKAATRIATKKKAAPARKPARKPAKSRTPARKPVRKGPAKPAVKRAGARKTSTAKASTAKGKAATRAAAPKKAGRATAPARAATRKAARPPAPKAPARKAAKPARPAPAGEPTPKPAAARAPSRPGKPEPAPKRAAPPPKPAPVRPPVEETPAAKLDEALAHVGQEPTPSKAVEKPARPAGPGRPRKKIDLFDDIVAVEPEVEEEVEPLYPVDEEGETLDFVSEPIDEIIEPVAAVSVRRKRKKKKRLLEDDEELEIPVPRKRKKVKRRHADTIVRPSPPLQQTDPLGDYLAGRMVPCPVGCGGFSEVVRVATLENGSGEVWFECLSCAQRKQFILPKASKNENADIRKVEEEGREPQCPRHSVSIALRRRGRQFVCPGCGVVFSP